MKDASSDKREKIKVIPAILAKDFFEFKQKLSKVENSVDFVQIDVMDGRFVPNKTFQDIEKIKEIETKTKFEIHLMVQEPRQEIEKWSHLPFCFRIVFHIEAEPNSEKLIDLVKRYNLEAGIAINPETPLRKIKNILDKLDCVIIMGVNPGFSGQKFQPMILDKIKEIKKIAPSLICEVDGGVNFKNAKKIKEAGADVLVSASAIFEAKDVQRAIERLKAE